MLRPLHRARHRAYKRQGFKSSACESKREIQFHASLHPETRGRLEDIQRSAITQHPLSIWASAPLSVERLLPLLVLCVTRYWTGYGASWDRGTFLEESQECYKQLQQLLDMIALIHWYISHDLPYMLWITSFEFSRGLFNNYLAISSTLRIKYHITSNHGTLQHSSHKPALSARQWTC